ncbi:hypothetical protein QQP08_017249 [Theobroma cacao]|nr:hypothetical protein QQP08_017249 [Theobroma cacao]
MIIIKCYLPRAAESFGRLGKRRKDSCVFLLESRALISECYKSAFIHEEQIKCMLDAWCRVLQEGMVMALLNIDLSIVCWTTIETCHFWRLVGWC